MPGEGQPEGQAVDGLPHVVPPPRGYSAPAAQNKKARRLTSYPSLERQAFDIELGVNDLPMRPLEPRLQLGDSGRYVGKVLAKARHHRFYRLVDRGLIDGRQPSITDNDSSVHQHGSHAAPRLDMHELAGGA